MSWAKGVGRQWGGFRREFLGFPYLGPHYQAVVEIRPALKWGPPDASVRDERKRGGRKRGVAGLGSHERAHEHGSDFQRDTWGSGSRAGRGASRSGAGARRPLPSSGSLGIHFIYSVSSC